MKLYDNELLNSVVLYIYSWFLVSKHIVFLCIQINVFEAMYFFVETW